MRSINLLPRKPYLQQIFVPAVIGIVFVSLSSFSLLYYLSAGMQSDINRMQERITQTEKRTKELASQRQTDPLTLKYNSFTSLIHSLKKARYNWIPFLDLVSNSLSTTARVTSVNVSDGKVTVSAEFGSIPDIADYMILLQKNSIVESLKVNAITRTERAVSASSATPVKSPSPAAGKQPAETASTPKPGSATSTPSLTAGAAPAPSVPTGDSQILLGQLQQALTAKWNEANASAPAGASASSNPQGNGKGGSVTVYTAILEVKLKPTIEAK